MIDTRSSVAIIFYEAVKQMEYKDSDPKHEQTPLTGFAGETTLSMGTIRHQIDACGVQKTCDFIVVGRPAPFYAILRKPWLYAIKAVASMYHQCVKFPSGRGTATIYGNQVASRIYYRNGHTQARSTDK
ncbi:hypothetical protein V5N11_003687 [Cardamine amara subsp. amara]|uniref:Uncharacterized protein n=1 Tax=Cardamine amara subsp. amara TaxID=228776 RepID=A0ABD1A451_CARAN